MNGKPDTQVDSQLDSKLDTYQLGYEVGYQLEMWVTIGYPSCYQVDNQVNRWETPCISDTHWLPGSKPDRQSSLPFINSIYDWFPIGYPI